jgi:hypothetical protein
LRWALSFPDQCFELLAPSALNRTTYLFTEISFAAMIASVVPTVDESESSNSFNLVEAGD